MLSPIKRNSSPSLTWYHKFNMYKSMIVPIIMYGSCVCFPSKTDLKTIEQVQRRAADWILGYPDTSYKTRLKTLATISMNMQIHDVLTLSKIMENKYNFDWRRFLSFNQPSYNTRNSSLQVFSLPILNLEVSRGNFWYRTPRLLNIISKKIDVSRNGLKGRLLHFFWQYFNNFFDVDRLCTWRFACMCSGCRDTLN